MCYEFRNAWVIFALVALLSHCGLIRVNVAASGSFSIVVNSDGDSLPNSAYCADSDASTPCNLRSAWSACASVDTSTTNLCNITTLGTRNMQFNSTYGPLMLSSSSPAIILSGSQSTVTCIDCGALTTGIPGFPYQTGNLTMTNNAQVNTAAISITACRGSQLDLSTCSSYVGDTFLRLYNADNVQVASNDNSCGSGSRITYTVTSSFCQQFTLRMGCAGNTACSMTVTGAIRRVKGYLSFLSYQQGTTVTTQFPSLTVSSLIMSKMAMALYVNGNANISFSNCSFVNVRNDNGTAIGLTNMMKGFVTIAFSRFSNIRGSLGSALFVNNSRVPIQIQQTVFLNSTAVSGGAIYLLRSVYNVQISNCVFSGISATNVGGAVYIGQFNQDIVISKSLFVNTVATNFAGAIYGLSYNSRISLVDSVFRGCQSARGAAFYFDSYNKGLTISGSTFQSCKASVHGGGGYILSYNQNIQISQTLFLSCTAAASGRGGGLIFFSYNSFISVFNSTFDGGFARQGGGLEFTSYHSNVLIDLSSFTNNNATNFGGAIDIQTFSQNITVRRCVFRNCVAAAGTTAAFGGGIAVISNNQQIFIADSVFDNCRATSQGGGVYYNSLNTQMQVRNCTFKNSKGTNWGAGIAWGSGFSNFSVVDSTFAGLSVISNGGAIATGSSSKDILFKNLLFSNCYAPYYGGAIILYNTTTNLVISDVIIKDSKALGAGGGIFMYTSLQNILIQNTQFINCTCPYNTTKSLSSTGGAISVNTKVSQLTIKNTLFTKCSAAKGGAIALISGVSNVLMTNLTFSRSDAYSSPGISISTYVTNVTIQNSTFADTSSPNNGAGMIYFALNNTGLVVDRCIFRNLSVSGITSDGPNSRLKISNNQFVACSSRVGAGVYMNTRNTYVDILNNQFHYCKATSDGGGVYVRDSNKFVNIVNNLFDHCSGGDSGAIFVDTSNSYVSMVSNTYDTCVGQYGAGIGVNFGNTYVTIDNSNFRNCYTKRSSTFSAEGRGGGISFGNFNKNITIRSSVFYNCTASNGGGGGIMMDSSNDRIKMQNLVFIKCREKVISGGAMFIQQSNTRISMSNITISQCTAAVSGGGIYFGPTNSAVNMANMSFSNCSAIDGGAMYIMQSNAAVVLQNVKFINNAASSMGGAMYLGYNNTNVIIGGSTFQSNSAATGGALALYDSNYQVVIIDSQGAMFSASRRITFIGTYGGVSPLSGPLEDEPVVPQVSYGLMYSASYTFPAGAIRVILAFDKKSSIVPTAEDVSISVGNKVIFTTYTNNFPGIQMPAWEIIGTTGTIITVSYTSRASAAVYGLLFYCYPVFNQSAVSTVATKFTNNVATSGSGGALYVFSNNLYVSVINAMFQSNRALGASGSGGAAYFWDSNSGLVLTGSQVFGNYAQMYGGGLALVSAHAGVQVSSCQFESNSAGSSGGSVSMETSNGVGVYSIQNRVLIINSTISDSAAPLGGGLFYEKSNTVDFVWTVIQNNTATASSGGGIYANNANTIRLNRTVVLGNQAAYNGGGLYLAYRNAFNLNSTVLQNNSAGTMGGGLYIQSDSTVTLTNLVTVSQNEAGFGGGGIALLHAPLWTASTKGAQLVLADNWAERGSAIFMDELVSSSAVICNTTFINNVASIGGTVFWMYEANVMETPPPGLNTSTVRFFNNTAGYGDIATQEITLHVPLYYTVQQFESSLSPPLVVNMSDYYGQFVSSSNESSVSITQSTAAYNCSGNPPSLLGSDLNGVGVKVESGIATFASLQAFCTPGGYSMVTFESRLGDFLGVPSGIQDLFTIQNLTTFDFRGCQVGEYQSNGKCIKCQNGSYSLELGVTTCKSCVGMTGVSACYADQIVLDDGYWRRYSTNEAILTCPRISTSCVGGAVTGSDTCYAGYEGPLCAVCSSGYYMSSNECKECTPRNEASVELILLVLFLASLLVAGCGSIYYRYVYVDVVDLKRKLEQSLVSGQVTQVPQLTSFHLVYLWFRKKMNEITVRLKIFTSTYQVVVATGTVLDVSMPIGFSGFCSAFQFVNLDVYSVFPVGCNHEFNFMDELLWETLVPLIMTALLGLYVFIAYGLYRYYQKEASMLKSYEEAKERALSFFFYLSYLVLPSVSVKIFQTFICESIDPNNEDPSSDDYYLTADMSISCTSSYYYDWVGYAIFMVFVYPVGIPLIYFLMLYANRHIIQNRYEVVKQEDQKTLDKVNAALKQYSKNPLHRQHTDSVPSSILSEKEVSANEKTNEQVGADASTISATDDHSEKKDDETEQKGEQQAVSSQRLAEHAETTADATSVVATSEPQQQADKSEESSQRAPSTASTTTAAWKPSKDQIMHRLPAYIASISFLWAAYEPRYWYWEVIEAVRRIMLTAVLSVVSPGTSEQNVFSLLLALLFIKLYGHFNPFESSVHNMMTELGQFQVFFTYLAAMTMQNSLLSSDYTVAVGTLLILINLSLPFLSCYYTMKNFQADRQRAIKKAAEKKKAQGDQSRPSLSDFFSRASRSVSSRFSSSSAKGSAKQRRRSVFEEQADEDFNLAVEWQVEHRMTMTASEKMDLPTMTNGDVEMNVIRSPMNIMRAERDSDDDDDDRDEQEKKRGQVDFRKSALECDSDDEEDVDGERHVK